MNNAITRYIPDFFDIGDGKPLIREFNSLNELLEIDFVNSFYEIKDFYRFSLSDNILMCELKDGKKWWVIGYIKYPEKLDLPVWVPHYDIVETTNRQRIGHFISLSRQLSETFNLYFDRPPDYGPIELYERTKEGYNKISLVQDTPEFKEMLEKRFEIILDSDDKKSILKLRFGDIE